MTMNLRIQLTSEDCLKAQLLNMRKSHLTWALLTAVIVLISASFVWDVLTLPRQQVHWLVSFAPIAGVCLLIIYKVWLPWHARKIFRQQKALQELQEVEISSEGLMTTSSRGSWKMKWVEFHKYKIGSDLILVYLSDAAFHAFPKRFFSEEEYALFQSYLATSLGKPKK